MRGFPLLNGVIAIGLLVVFGVILSKLTSEGNPSSGSAGNTDFSPLQETLFTSATIKLAHKASSISLTHLDKTIWSTETPESNTLEFDLELADDLEEHGIEIGISISWPEGTPETIAELTLTPDGLDERSARVWAEGSLDDILTFVWN